MPLTLSFIYHALFFCAGKGNGEPSKSRKFVAEADCYDDLVAWLDWEFHKNDINKDGYLDYHEFVK